PFVSQFTNLRVHRANEHTEGSMIHLDDAGHTSTLRPCTRTAAMKYSARLAPLVHSEKTKRVCCARSAHDQTACSGERSTRRTDRLRSESGLDICYPSPHPATT